MEMLPPLLLLLLLASSAAAATTSSSFSLDFFPGTGAVAQLALSGAANATTSGAVSMAYPRARVQYKLPLVFSTADGEEGRGGFSTYFSFALPPQPPPSASLAFFLTPSPSPPAPRSPLALAVVFTATHVRVDLAGRTAALRTQSRSVTVNRTTRLHSWIDYNASSAVLHVRLSAAARGLLPNPPPAALLSYPLDLSPVLRRGAPVRAGFQSSGGNCTIFSWAFHGAPYQMHSQPLNPADLLLSAPPPPPPPDRAPDTRYYGPSWGAAVSLLFAAACGATVTFFVLFLWYSVAARRRPVAPVEHPTDVVYEKIVLVGAKEDDDGTPSPSPSPSPSGGNNK